MPFLDCPHAPANCLGSQGGMRPIATRLWHFQQTPTADLVAVAHAALSKLQGRAGRVESAGAFHDPRIELELRLALAERLGANTRQQMEWYGCRGAYFHNDAHYDGVLFGVWCVASPPRDLVFPRIGCRLPVQAGNLVVFDPFEPHAVLQSGATRYRSEDYKAAEASLFLGFEVELTAEVRRMFGIGAIHADAPTLSSRVAINPETGAPATTAA